MQGTFNGLFCLKGIEGKDKEDGMKQNEREKCEESKVIVSLENRRKLEKINSRKRRGGEQAAERRALFHLVSREKRVLLLK